ncbi:sigma factor-binding protein Crl [Streptomyces sp. NBRC 110611]|nr:sigma factor-binding protein Crl [Streptomyces sp. NBRC 110611]
MAAEPLKGKGDRHTERFVGGCRLVGLVAGQGQKAGGGRERLVCWCGGEMGLEEGGEESEGRVTAEGREL